MQNKLYNYHGELQLEWGDGLEWEDGSGRYKPCIWLCQEVREGSNLREEKKFEHTSHVGRRAMSIARLE